MGGVLLEVDNHLIRLAHHLIVERLRGKINFGKWHRLMKNGASFFGFATSQKKQRLKILGGHDEKKQRLVILGGHDEILSRTNGAP